MENNNLVQTTPQVEPTPSLPINQPENQEQNEKKVIKVSFKINPKLIIVGVIIIVIILLAYFFKGLFIAATVDGSPIGRLTVIQKLEKDSGKALLDSLVTEKLIQNEANTKNIVVTDDQINAEIKRVETQVVAQGGTLEIALSAQNMTIEDLKKRIFLQKEIEGLIADKINVTDQEIAQYIIDNKVSVTKGQEAAVNQQVKTEIANQKLNKEADALISELKAKAKIQYFVNY